ncbi:MAG TPA: DUF5679 domain-containing protein [Roseiflexaceae bacterium]
MLKRIFRLALVAAAGWLIWRWVRQLRQDFADTTPQFAPSMSATPLPRAAMHADHFEALDVAGAPAPPTDEPAAPASDAGAAGSADLATSITTADENERATAEAASVAAAGESGESTSLDHEVLGYCVRCKTKRPIAGAHAEITESGRRAARGTCPVCGANMFTFLAGDGDEPAKD